MFTYKVLIRFESHHAHITATSKALHIFKYNSRTCDFGVFPTSRMGKEEAGNYIVDPLPTTYYSVTFPGEDSVNPF